MLLSRPEAHGEYTFLAWHLQMAVMMGDDESAIGRWTTGRPATERCGQSQLATSMTERPTADRLARQSGRAFGKTWKRGLVAPAPCKSTMTVAACHHITMMHARMPACLISKKGLCAPYLLRIVLCSPWGSANNTPARQHKSHARARLRNGL